jgi:hypothetical protein
VAVRTVFAAYHAVFRPSVPFVEIMQDLPRSGAGRVSSEDRNVERVGPRSSGPQWCRKRDSPVHGDPTPGRRRVDARQQEVAGSSPAGRRLKIARSLPRQSAPITIVKIVFDRFGASSNWQERLGGSTGGPIQDDATRRRVFESQQGAQDDSRSLTPYDREPETLPRRCASSVDRGEYRAVAPRLQCHSVESAGEHDLV